MIPDIPRDTSPRAVTNAWLLGELDRMRNAHIGMAQIKIVVEGPYVTIRVRGNKEGRFDGDIGKVLDAACRDLRGEIEKLVNDYIKGERLDER